MLIERVNNRKKGPIESYKMDLIYKQIIHQLNELDNKSNAIKSKIELETLENEFKSEINKNKIDQYYKNKV